MIFCLAAAGTVMIMLKNIRPYGILLSVTSASSEVGGEKVINNRGSGFSQIAYDILSTEERGAYE